MDFPFFNKKKGAAPGAPKTENGGAVGNGNGGVIAPPNSGDGGGEGRPQGGSFKPDPKKAKAWFQRGKDVADSRQYDYAIECFTQGFKFDPDNMDAHEALRDVALRRRVNGGKPASLGDKMGSGGKTPLERLLHTEIIWSKEPLSLQWALAVMERAVEVADSEPELNMAELANWVGETVAFKGERDRPLKKADLVKLRELFRAIKMYEHSIECGKAALSQDREDLTLMPALREIETEWSLAKSQERHSNRKDMEFLKDVKDVEQQKVLDIQDRIVKTDTQADMVITQRRKEVVAAPDDNSKQAKLADALQERDSDATQEEAIKIYQGLFEKNKEYVYKERADEIRIKQLRRQCRDMKKVADAASSDAELAKGYQEKLRQLREYELAVWSDRVRNYPTEAQPKFKMGELLFAFKRYDEAISAFQQTKVAPAFKVRSMSFLGRCFLVQGWLDEAINTLIQGMAAHPVANDQLGMELRYIATEAYEQAARKTRDPGQAEEARRIASEILQNDINYKDIRDRMTRIRQLVDELEKERKAPEA